MTDLTIRTFNPVTLLWLEGARTTKQAWGNLQDNSQRGELFSCSLRMRNLSLVWDHFSAFAPAARLLPHPAWHKCRGAEAPDLPPPATKPHVSPTNVGLGFEMHTVPVI